MVDTTAAMQKGVKNMKKEISYKNIMKRCVKEALKELNENEITYRVRLVAYQKFAKAIKE